MATSVDSKAKHEAIDVNFKGQFLLKGGYKPAFTALFLFGFDLD